MSFEPLLSSFQVKPLNLARKANIATTTCSIDLNRTEVMAVILAEGVQIEGHPLISWEVIDKISEGERKVYMIMDSLPHQVSVYSEVTGWVRTLCATEFGAPTTLISGIPMHRIKDTDPMEDTFLKMRAFGRVCGRVLDTATGLGYTAIEAGKSAREVVTIELDPAAIEIAKFNPWSENLFTSKKIRQVIGDTFEEIQKQPSNSFEGILHDPPTMALGGELYSQEFYLHLHRVLERGGRLFHYVGDPNSGIGSKHYPGILKRLKTAGFKRVEIRDIAHGVTANT